MCGTAGHLDNLVLAAGGNLLNKAGSTQLLSSELVDVWHWDATRSLADEVDIIALNILDDHDALLSEEMQSHIIDGIT